LCPSLILTNCDRLDDTPGVRAHEVDQQQSVFQVRSQHIHALGQHEGALELTGSDAAVQVLAGLVVLLAPADHELVLLDRDLELVTGKTRNGKRDTQPLWVLRVTCEPLDVVGRIAIGGLGDAVERTLDLIESEEERT